MKNNTKIETLGDDINDISKERLRVTLLNAYKNFETYRTVFDQIGISHSEIVTLDPKKILDALPLLDTQSLNRLSNESINNGNAIVDIETSSGTTGQKKRRMITGPDGEFETAFISKLFNICGIKTYDQVACLDTSPLTLMVSFMRALEYMCVRESYCYTIGVDADAHIKTLARLKPTVLITIPSILEICLTSLSTYVKKTPDWHLNKIIYVGERLADSTRYFLETELQIEIFAYYGSSETSALGIECENHSGIHLYTDRNIFEILATSKDDVYGEILITTLFQNGLPLLRYPVGDSILPKIGECDCKAKRYPRVEVIGRTDGSVSIMGIQFSYDSFHKIVCDLTCDYCHMEVTILKNIRETIRIVLSGIPTCDSSKIKKSILDNEHDLGYLVSGGFIDLDIQFVNQEYFSDKRKSVGIVDCR